MAHCDCPDCKDNDCPNSKEQREWRESVIPSTVLLDALTDDELSALICACQLAEDTEMRGRHVRPPWGRCGTAAHRKLIKAEMARASNAANQARSEAEIACICPVGHWRLK